MGSVPVVPAPTSSRDDTRGQTGRAPSPLMPLPVSLALVCGVPAMLAVLALAMAATGAAAPSAIGDPGAVVRWTLPAVRALVDIAASLTLGSMAFLALASRTGTRAWARVAALGAGAGVVWVLGACAQLVLGFADIAGQPLGSLSFGTQLGYFLTSVSPGQVLLASVVGAVLAATVAAVGVRTPAGAAVGAVLAGVALIPPALASHSGAVTGHHTVVTAWWLHGLGVGVWLGGLVALAVAGPVLADELAPAVRRYSTLALAAFTLVVVSGVVNGWVQVGESAGHLLTGYGALLAGKSLAALVLGVAGWAHRSRTLPALERGSAAAFWRIVAVEVLVMAAAVGLAVALVRTGPPAGSAVAPTSLAARITDESVPAMPATIGRLLLTPRPDLLWLTVVVALLGAYLAGVRRLRSRGDRWPVGRTLVWSAGCLLLGWVTSFGPAAYLDLLFSAHMIAHMVVMSLVPPLLVLGAPVTLAVRALHRRADGSRGPREWLLVLVHSRVAQVVGHPVVAAVLFAGSLVAFYYSPLFGLALRTHVGHELMLAHFLTVGYLFATAVIGVDPGTARAAFPLRLLLLLATMAFHAFFGVVLMNGDALLAASWFSSLGLGVDALADQQKGGAIAWGLGELPTLVMIVVLAVQWSRSDDREARRRDRAADRDGDADLVAYNAMLAARAPGGGRPGGRSGDRQEP